MNVPQVSRKAHILCLTCGTVDRGKHFKKRNGMIQSGKVFDARDAMKFVFDLGDAALVIRA